MVFHTFSTGFFNNSPYTIVNAVILTANFALYLKYTYLPTFVAVPTNTTSARPLLVDLNIVAVMYITQYKIYPQKQLRYPSECNRQPNQGVDR